MTSNEELIHLLQPVSESAALCMHEIYAVDLWYTRPMHRGELDDPGTRDVEGCSDVEQKKTFDNVVDRIIGTSLA